MIIVEGPDGAGKSTLIDSLRGLLRLPLGVRSSSRDRLWETTVADSWQAVAEDVNPRSEPYLWDRFFWSEMIYSQIMQRKCAFTVSEAVRLRDVLESIDALLILCMPRLEVVRRNVVSTEQHAWVNETTIDEIYNRYAELVNPQHPFSLENMVIHDYTRPLQTHTVMGHVMIHLEQRKRIWI